MQPINTFLNRVNSKDDKLVEMLKEHNDEEIEINGLKGHKATYGNEKYQYFEARFLIDESAEGTTELSIIITTYNNNIERIKALPEFNKILDGIRRSQPEV